MKSAEDWDEAAWPGNHPGSFVDFIRAIQRDALEAARALVKKADDEACWGDGDAYSTAGCALSDIDDLLKTLPHPPAGHQERDR